MDGASESKQVDFLDYVEIIVRRRRIIVACTVVAVGLGALLELRSEPPLTFSAEANAVVSENWTYHPESGEIWDGAGLSTEHLKSAHVAQRVLNTRMPYEGGEQDSILLWEYLSPGATVRTALNRLWSVAEVVTGEDRVVTIRVEMGDPLITAATANALLDETIRYHTESRALRSGRILAYLDDRMAKLEQGIREAERELVAFKRKHRGSLAGSDPIDDLIQDHDRKQQLVETRSDLYESLLEQRETVRMRYETEPPVIEILNRAETTPIPGATLSSRSRLGIAFGAGIVIGLAVAFLLDAGSRLKKSGRLEGIKRAWGDG